MQLIAFPQWDKVSSFMCVLARQMWRGLWSVVGNGGGEDGGDFGFGE